jgi:protein TonB
MYIRRNSAERTRTLPATFVASVAVAALFAVLPFAHRINIERQTRFGGDRSPFATAPPQAALESTGVVLGLIDPLGDAPADAKTVNAAEPNERVPLDIPPRPVLELARPDARLRHAFVFDSADLDYVPIPIHRVAPEYPEELKYKSIEGRAVVEFRVDQSGSVQDVVVLETDHPDFGASVAAAVLRWRFVPGMVRGEVVRFRMRLPVNFRLLDAADRPVLTATRD